MNEMEPIAFFCTRCGAGLRVLPDRGGQRVRCPQCATAVVAPNRHEAIPIADLAMPREEAQGAGQPLSEDDAAEMLQTLDYALCASARVPQRDGESLDVLAERLTRVEMPEPGEESAMTDCPFCGSTIAPYVGRCPFCRHPLHGS